MTTPLLSDKYLYAICLVARLFKTHSRKVGNTTVGDTPYVSHLYGVAHIVSQFTKDEDTLLAALLHDVLEDIPADVYGAAQMEAEFGKPVVELVQTVSHDQVTYTPDVALRRYLDQIQAGPVAACLITGADILYNGKDMLANYAENPEETMRVFGKPESAARRKWFWGGRLETMSTRLGADHPLVLEVGQLLPQLEKVGLTQ